MDWEIVSGYQILLNYEDNVYTTIINKQMSSITGITYSGEKNSQYITFIMDRYYDGIDLSSKLINICYKIEGTQNGGSDAPINVYRNDNQIKFGWIIPYACTANANTISLGVLVVGTEYGQDYIFKTNTSKYSITQGFISGNGIIEPDDNWFEQFLIQYDNNANSNLEIYNTNATNKILAYNNNANSKLGDFNNLSDRLDALNTELIDIRVGAYGKTYSTAGDAVRGQITDLGAYIGYFPNNVIGLHVDFQNMEFTRLAGAENLTGGADFNKFNMYGGRKRCLLTDGGVVIAYNDGTKYVCNDSNGTIISLVDGESGLLTTKVIINGTTYAVGTKVQVMVEQPKFYYKVVPLTLDKTDFKEINTIAVTGGATASGNLTISLDGVNFTVAVTSGDDVTAVATKIRNTAYTGWLTGGSGTSVTFTCNVTGTKVTATVTAASTGVTTTVTKTQPGYKGKGHHMRKARYYVSDTPRTGFKLHPAFVSNNVKKNFIYLSAYEASLYDVSASAYILDDAQVADFTVTTGDKMCSIANAKPMSGITQNLIRSNTRKLAQNRGTGWQQAYVATVAASHLLMLIEYASFNMQSKIGNGAVSKDEGTTNMSEPTGATTLLGNASGIAVNTNGVQFVSYRGEENFWGNIWKWVDGINIYANNEQSIYVADNGFTDDVGTSPYSDVGFTGAKREGYVSAFGYSEGFDWLFYPSETFGDSNLPVGDYHWLNSQSNGWFVARLGGKWNDGSCAGAFGWNVYHSSSDRYRTIGGRLVYVPSTVA